MVPPLDHVIDPKTTILHHYLTPPLCHPGCLPSQVKAEPRVFMSGLSDEAGAAMPLAMASKQVAGLPVTVEIERWALR